MLPGAAAVAVPRTTCAGPQTGRIMAAARPPHRARCASSSSSSSPPAALLGTTTSTDAAPAPTSSLQLLRRVSDYAAAHASQLRTLQLQAPGAVRETAQLLDDIYDDLDARLFHSKGGYALGARERAAIDATGGSATYGEVLPAGLDAILSIMALDARSVFVDLGSGRWRAVLQAALAAPHMRAALGLELSDSRLEQADAALRRLRGDRDRGHAMAPVEFRRADLAACSLTEGTHFYLCSTAFSSSLCRSLAQRLAASPSFQVLVTSRQLPTQPHLYWLGDAPCEYSFTGAGRAFVYVKSLDDAPLPVAARFLCSDGVCWLPTLQPQGHRLSIAIGAEEELGAPQGAQQAAATNKTRFISLQQPPPPQGPC